MNIDELRAELVRINRLVQAIQTAADAENRDLTDAETKQLDGLFTEFEKVRVEIETQGQADYLNQSQGRDVPPARPHNKPGNAGFDGSRKPHGNKRVLFRNLISGEAVTGYQGSQPISAPADDTSVGEIIQAMLLNDLSGLPRELRNAVTAGSDTGGGYLFDPTVSSRVIDLARANSVVLQAGATTVPMTTGDLHLGRLTADATAYWRPETAAITASNPTFDKVILRPKVLAALIPVSIEWLEDIPNGGQIITTAVSKALSAELDRAALTGDGAAGEPEGVRNNADVNAIGSVGTPTTYADISAAIGDILTANYTGAVSDLAWVAHPREGETYDGLVTGITSDNTPLQPTPWVSELRRLYTTQLSITEGAGSNESSMIVGSFPELLIGMRTSGVVVEVLNSGTTTDSDSTTWNAATQLMRHIRVYLRADVALARPTWFTVLSGVTSA